jgi:excisionase family DNA binding protein
MHEDWITKEEALQRTGMSERTLERRIKGGELRKAYRNVPGRKPLPVLHPEDVAKYEAKTVTPIALKGAPKKLLKEVPNGAIVPSSARRDVAALMAGLSQQVTLDKKFYLTLDEATQLSGLPKSFLIRKIREGLLPAVKAGGYRVRRIHLEQYDAVTGTMTA